MAFVFRGLWTVARWSVKPALLTGLGAWYAVYDTPEVAWIDDYDPGLRAAFEGKGPTTVMDACQQQVPLSALASSANVRGDRRNPIVRAQSCVSVSFVCMCMFK